MWEIEPQITLCGNVDKMPCLHEVVIEDFQKNPGAESLELGNFQRWMVGGVTGKNF